MPEITEFEVTYIAKEYLKRNWRSIIAYNPPWSQWTFTIPDPIKDPNYRWQTGSMSPDIVAYKRQDNKFLIVESKPRYNRKDVEKMIKMFETPNRVKVFYRIVEWYAIANNLDVTINQNTQIIFAKAHSWNPALTERVNTILINKTSEFDPHDFLVNDNIYWEYNIQAYFSNTNT